MRHPAPRRIQGPQATHHVVVEVPRSEVVKRQRLGWARTLPEPLRQAVPPELAGYEIETSSAADFDLLLEDA